jgi:hypothetical protein
MRPRIFKDGDSWCCVYGDQPECVEGWGNSPEDACRDFDKVWSATKDAPDGTETKMTFADLNIGDYFQYGNSFQYGNRVAKKINGCLPRGSDYHPVNAKQVDPDEDLSFPGYMRVLRLEKYTPARDTLGKVLDESAKALGKAAEALHPSENEESSVRVGDFEVLYHINTGLTSLSLGLEANPSKKSQYGELRPGDFFYCKDEEYGSEIGLVIDSKTPGRQFKCVILSSGEVLTPEPTLTLLKAEIKKGEKDG